MNVHFEYCKPNVNVRGDHTQYDIKEGPEHHKYSFMTDYKELGNNIIILIFLFCILNISSTQPIHQPLRLRGIIGYRNLDSISRKLFRLQKPLFLLLSSSIDIVLILHIAPNHLNLRMIGQHLIVERLELAFKEVHRIYFCLLRTIMMLILKRWSDPDIDFVFVIFVLFLSECFEGLLRFFFRDD